MMTFIKNGLKAICIFFDTFSNRELALLTWLVFLTILVLTQKSFRKLFTSIFKLLLFSKLTIIIISIIIYSIGIIYILYKYNFWNISMLKDTILWMFGALALILNSSNEVNNKSIKRLFIDCLKFSIIIEFIFGLYTFNYLTELIIQAIIFIFMLTSLPTSIDKKYIQAEHSSKKILQIIGWSFTIFIIFKITTEYEALFKLDNLMSIILPSILTIFIIPIYYLIRNLMCYENIYVRINKNRTDKNKLFIGILKISKLNLDKVNLIYKNLSRSGLFINSSTSEILLFLEQLCKSR